MERASAIARDHRAFHWELAFPEVFFDAGGRPRADAGFDAVIGNPPWDMLRADLGSRADRESDARDAIRRCCASFGASGIYRYQGDGHPNRYQLFVERAFQLARSGGRVGLIVPAGLGSDHGSALLAATCSIGAPSTRGWASKIATRSSRFIAACASCCCARPMAAKPTASDLRCGLTDPSVLERHASVATEAEAAERHLDCAFAIRGVGSRASHATQRRHADGARHPHPGRRGGAKVVSGTRVGCQVRSRVECH